MPHTGQRLFNNKVLVNIYGRVRNTDSVYNKCIKKEFPEFPGLTNWCCVDGALRWKPLFGGLGGISN